MEKNWSFVTKDQSVWQNSHNVRNLGAKVSINTTAGVIWYLQNQSEHNTKSCKILYCKRFLIGKLGKISRVYISIRQD